MIGNRSMELRCWAVFTCGSPLESKGGLGAWANGPNVERAQQLLREAGYKNEPIVLMNPTENQMISAMAVVSSQVLKKAGFNIDMSESRGRFERAIVRPNLGPEPRPSLYFSRER